jgi:beta-lactamase regulating signal transducer with metallopeptidase domain
MSLLLEAALRACLLGACIWVLLKALRLKDARSETLAWTAVLLVALAMPLLTPLLEALLPGMKVMPAAPAAVAGEPGRVAPYATPLLVLYGAVTFILLARLGLGLVLTWKLYRDAAPLVSDETQAALRRSARLHSPLVFGRCILLPNDFAQWPRERRAAVLAHEECHMQRGDFFLLLLAGLYRALFWFSPFAWWLKARLGALAESDSDSAALARMGDRASYAQLLMDVSRMAHRRHGGVAMAGPGIAWRIERILDASRTEQALTRPARALLLTAVTAAALGFAGVHAEPRLARADATPLPAQNHMAAAPAIKMPAATVRADVPLPTRRPVPLRGNHMAFEVAEVEDYNPRALLDAPAVLIIPTALFATPQQK